MLRLNLYSSTLPCARELRDQSSYSSWLGKLRGAPRTCRVISVRVKASKDETNGGIGRSTDQQWDPGLEIEVPFEQRPVNEYTSLKDGALYSWGELSLQPFLVRLGGLWLVAFTVLGVPIAAGRLTTRCLTFPDIHIQIAHLAKLTELTAPEQQLGHLESRRSDFDTACIKSAEQ